MKGLPDETTSAASNVLHIWNATNNDNRTVVPGVYRFRSRVSDLAGNASLARGSIRVVR